MRNIIVIFALFWGAILYAGCTKCGCTDPDAINYDESAKKDDGSCVYPVDTIVDTPTDTPVDPRSKIVGKYICSRESRPDGSENNIKLEIFPVRTTDKLLRVWDESLNLTFLMTYDKNGNLRDTLLPEGLPGCARYFQTGGIYLYPRIVGEYSSDSLRELNYLWTSEQYIYSGPRVQTYPVVFDTPDYREQWIGTYEGTERSVWYNPDTSYVTTTDVTLEVSLTDNDSVVKIEEIGENPSLKDAYAFFYVKTDGSLKNRSYFSGDSLIINYSLGHSAASGGSVHYYCKKR